MAVGIAIRVPLKCIAPIVRNAVNPAKCLLSPREVVLFSVAIVFNNKAMMGVMTEAARNDSVADEIEILGEVAEVVILEADETPAVILKKNNCLRRCAPRATIDAPFLSSLNSDETSTVVTAWTRKTVLVQQKSRLNSFRH